MDGLAYYILEWYLGILTNIIQVALQYKTYPIAKILRWVCI